MKRRIFLLLYWLIKTNNVSFKDLISKIIDKTCAYKAKPFIEKIIEDGDYYKTSLKGIESPLYYPINMQLHSLYQVITESMYASDWHYFEAPETTVGTSDTVLDCGAAEGLFGLMVVKRCRKVYLIEPLPKFVDALMLTFVNYKNAEIVSYALSDEKNESFINDTDISSSISGKGNIPVKLDTIDNLFFNKGIKVDYIKADLEGYELKMLLGAEMTIKAYKPKIAITTYHAPDHAKEIEKLLLTYNPGYKIKTKGIEFVAGAPVMLHAW